MRLRAISIFKNSFKIAKTKIITLLYELHVCTARVSRCCQQVLHSCTKGTNLTKSNGDGFIFKINKFIVLFCTRMIFLCTNISWKYFNCTKVGKNSIFKIKMIIVRVASFPIAHSRPIGARCCHLAKSSKSEPRVGVSHKICCFGYFCLSAFDSNRRCEDQ